jgi:hypothetical protein
LKPFDFVGVGIREFNARLRKNHPNVESICIKEVEDRPSDERLEVAWIGKEVWDEVVEFDENIVLG